MSDAFRIRLENLERRIDDIEHMVRQLAVELARKQSHAVQHKGHGKFIVVNGDGEQATEDLLSREEALSVAEQLNALP